MTAIPPLSADLLPVIADPTIEMLLVRLVELAAETAVVDGLPVRTGPATFELLDVIHGKVFQRGQLLQVPVSQIVDPQTRFKNPVNHWNGVPLERGNLMLLACAPVPPNTPCIAQAGIRVDSPQGGTVQAVRDAYVIEGMKQLPDDERWNRLGPLLGPALQSRQELLFQYALDFTGRRAVLGREAGAMLLGRAMAHAGTLPAQRIEIGSHLVGRSRFFVAAKGTDRANIELLAALAVGLVGESEPRQRLQWVRFIAGTLLGEIDADPVKAAALRRSLAQAVQQPPRLRVAEALQGVQTSSTGVDQERAAALVALWR